MTDEKNFHDDDDDLSDSFEEFMDKDDVSEDDLADFLNDVDDQSQQTLAGNVDLDDEDLASSFLSDDDMPEAAPAVSPVGSNAREDHEDLDDDDLAANLADEDPEEDIDLLSDSDVQIPAIPHGTVEAPFFSADSDGEDALGVAPAAEEPPDENARVQDTSPETLWADDEDVEIDDDEYDFSDDDLEVAEGGIDGATEYYTDSMESDAAGGDDQFSGDDSEEILDDVSAEDDSDSSDEWETGSRDTLNQKPYESDFAPTVLSDMPEEDPEFSRSIGRVGTLLSGESFADDDDDEFESAGPATEAVGADSAQVGMSSQHWGTSSSAGLSSSLNVRERPVSGHEAPFSVQPDADYEIVEELARGGMGVVYIARQTSLDRMLAIKTLKLPDGSGSSGRGSRITRLQRECFLSEALVTANLVHPNIVPIHDLCQTREGIPFYSMKRVKGVPWVSATGPNGRTSADIKNDPIRTMGLSENLEVLLKVCDATAYAHSQGVVNRDLKPENVIIGDFGEVIVLDWGLAIFTPDSGRQNPESSTVSFGAGTAAYMAPELWTGPGEAIGRWSDIYLLGGMLFEILTGQAPHKFEMPKDVPKNPTPSERQRMKIDQINDVVGNNRIRETQVQGELLNIALKAMETDPEDRYKSVQEFQAAIREYQRHEESRHLTRRADQLMEGKTGAAKEGYEDYQTAAALYEEALRGWDGNQAAKEGLYRARLDNAKLAYKRGDFDLGLQLVAARPDANEYVSLQKKLDKAKKRRGAQKGLTIALASIIMVAGPAVATKFYFDGQELQKTYGDLDKAKDDLGAAETLKTEAVQERATALEEKAAAEILTATAKKQQEEAEKLRLKAQGKLEEVATNLKAAEDKLTDAVAKEAMATKELLAANAARENAMQAATDARQQADEAKVAVDAAEKQKLILEAENKIALQQQKAAAFAVDLQKVASQTLSLNLKEASDSIDELLKSDKLQALDETARKQRTDELKAQKEQLQQLLSQDTGPPVQSQRYDRGTSLVAWIHRAAGTGQAGSITVRDVDEKTGKPAEEFRARWTLESGEFVDAQFTQQQNTIACLTGNELTLWNYETKERTPIGKRKNAKFTVLEVDGDLLITATATRSGLIEGWSLDGKNLWQYESGTEVRALTVVKDMGLLICAGSRANTSADVLALRMTPLGLQRLEKGTQLQFTRDSLAPPQVVAISPSKDNPLMVLGNSRNGSILVLPKAKSNRSEASSDRSKDSKRKNPFPFYSPAELEESGSGNWLQSEHRRPVNAIAFSRDGTKFATASDDRTIGIWNVDQKAGRAVWAGDLQLKGHGAAVTDVAFVSNEILISTSRDRTSRVWNLSTYKDQLKNIEDKVEDILQFTERSEASPNTADVQATTPAMQPREPVAAASVSLTLPQSRLQTVETAQRRQYHPASLKSQPPATSSDVPYVILNDRSTSEEILRGGIRSVAITADGSRAATGGADGTAVLWNTADGKAVRGASEESIFHRRSRLFEEGHKFNVSRLMFLPPNEHICLSTSFDGSLCLWQANPEAGDLGAEKNRITGIRLINAVAASPDGSFIVTSALMDENEDESGAAMPDKHPCVIWNVAQLLTGDTPVPRGAMLNGFHRDIVTTIAVSADSRLIATGAKDGNLAIWNAADGQLLASVRAHERKTLVTDVAWLGSDQLLTAGVDGGIHRWTLSAGTESDKPSLKNVYSYAGDRKSPVDRLAVAPDQKSFIAIHATFLRKGQASVRSEEKRQQDPIIYEMKVRSIDGEFTKSIALAQAPRGEWTVQDDKRSSAGVISSVHWAKDGSQVAVVAGGQINLLNPQTWERAKVLGRKGAKGVKREITAAVFPSELSEASSKNLIATFDGTAAQLWNLDSSKLETTFQPMQAVRAKRLSGDDQDSFLPIALSKDDQHSFLATGGRSLRIYNSHEADAGYAQTLCKVMDPHAGGVTALAFTKDKQKLASGGADGTVKIWNWEASAGRLERPVKEELNSGVVVDLKWSDDGNTLLVVCAQRGFLLDLNTAPPQKINLDMPGQAAQQADIAGDEGLLEGIVFRCGDVKRDGTAIVLAGRSEITGGSIGLLYRQQDGRFVLQPDSFSGHGAGGITCAKFVETPESPYLVSGGNDGAAIIWNWSGDTPYEAYRFLMRDLYGAVHRAAVTDLAVAESTGAIATCSDDGTAIIWKNPLAKTDSL